MRFACESCSTRYSIPDERVQGRTLKVRCKKCGNVILVHGSPAVEVQPEPVREQPREPMDSEATVVASSTELRRLQEELRSERREQRPSPAREPEPPPAAEPEIQWFIIVAGQQEGPLSPAELFAKLESGFIKARSYVWHEQLADWKRVQEIPELAARLSEAAPAPKKAPAPPPTPPAEPEPAAAPEPEPVFEPRQAPEVAHEPTPVAQRPRSELGAIFDEISGIHERPSAPLIAASAPPVAEPLAMEKTPIRELPDLAPTPSDIFNRVPDSPHLVTPATAGEATRFVIARARVQEAASPKRIAIFGSAAAALLVGLVVLLSQLGMNLPLVGGQKVSEKHFQVKTDASLREQLLGKNKPVPAAHPTAAPAPTPSKTPKESGSLAHKEEQHVESLDDRQKKALTKLYQKPGAENFHLALSASPNQAPVIDRPDAPLTPQQVGATISHYQSGYARCIELELKRNPNFKGGKVRLVTTLTSSGLVKGVEIQGDDSGLVRRLQDSPLGGCLVDQTRRMVFPTFSGDPFDAEIPLVLGAAM